MQLDGVAADRSGVIPTHWPSRVCWCYATLVLMVDAPGNERDFDQARAAVLADPQRRRDGVAARRRRYEQDLRQGAGYARIWAVRIEDAEGGRIAWAQLNRSDRRHTVGGTDIEMIPAHRRSDASSVLEYDLQRWPAAQCATRTGNVDGRKECFGGSTGHAASRRDQMELRVAADRRCGYGRSWLFGAAKRDGCTDSPSDSRRRKKKPTHPGAPLGLRDERIERSRKQRNARCHSAIIGSTTATVKQARSVVIPEHWPSRASSHLRAGVGKRSAGATHGPTH
jgi:hypothetical protein